MREDGLSTVKRAAFLITGILCMGMGSTPPTATGDISVTTGHIVLTGGTCLQNPSRNVTITATPLRLYGGGGHSTTQTKIELMPTTPTNLGADEVGQPVFGCQVATTFHGLNVGEWVVNVSGPFGPRSCTVSVRFRNTTYIKLFGPGCEE